MAVTQEPLAPPRALASTDAPLFDGGLHGPHVEDYRRRVRGALQQIRPLQERAEAERAFPREAVRILGEAGLLRERWACGGHGDLGRSVTLAEELGYAGLGGVGIGISLHLEAVLAILTRFARSEPVRAACEEALDGRLVGCLATSERHAGSDLTSVAATLRSAGADWIVSGRKWFVSPGAAADFALVLCRRDDDGGGGGERRSGRLAPLALVFVPATGFTVERTLETVGMRSLGTARIAIDAQVTADAVVARPGAGLATVTWGLIHERLAVAAQVLGTARLAIALAVSHSRRRHQFSAALFDHQALRLRLADLSAQVELACRGVRALAAELPSLPEHGLRAAASAKVTATRLAARVVDEAMHLFGGTGYVETETPVGRIWRDSRIGRLGAGSDEMMWEIVAGGLRGDDDAYDTLMAIGT